MALDPNHSAGHEPAVQPGLPARLPRPEKAVTRAPYMPAAPPTPQPRSTVYFGKTVTASTGRPIWGTLFLIIGLAILAVSWHFQNSRIAGVVAPPCFALAAAFLRGWVFPLRCRFDEEGVALTGPRRFLRYGDIQEVFTIGDHGEGQFAIYLLLEVDAVRLPPTLDTPARALVDFLRSQPLGERPVPRVPAIFANFLKQQLLVARPEEIYVFHATKKRVSPRARRYRRACGWLALVAGAWFALAAIDRSMPVYSPLGAMASLFAFIFLLGGFTPLRFSPARFKNWDDVVVIVTPLALALQQGDLRGELRWEELLGTTYSGWRGGVPKDLSSLTLKVRGAVIPLLDVFQWPLDCAAELIKIYAGK